MANKVFKNNSLINIVVVVSLLINIILINKLLDYQNFIYENTTRSIRHIESDLADAEEILSQIIQSGEINEWQYRIIYSVFDSFEDEYKRILYRHYFELESKEKDFSDIHLLFDMNDYIFNFGKEKQLSLHKSKKDNVVTIELTEKELEQFKNITNKTNEYLNILDNSKIDRDKGIIQNWGNIVDGIYEKGLGATIG